MTVCLLTHASQSYAVRWSVLLFQSENQLIIDENKHCQFQNPAEKVKTSRIDYKRPPEILLMPNLESRDLVWLLELSGNQQYMNLASQEVEDSKDFSTRGCED